MGVLAKEHPVLAGMERVGLLVLLLVMVALLVDVCVYFGRYK